MNRYLIGLQQHYLEMAGAKALLFLPSALKDGGRTFQIKFSANLLVLYSGFFALFFVYL